MASRPAMMYECMCHCVRRNGGAQPGHVHTDGPAGQMYRMASIECFCFAKGVPCMNNSSCRHQDAHNTRGTPRDVFERHLWPSLAPTCSALHCAVPCGSRVPNLRACRDIRFSSQLCQLTATCNANFANTSLAASFVTSSVRLDACALGSQLSITSGRLACTSPLGEHYHAVALGACVEDEWMLTGTVDWHCWGRLPGCPPHPPC